MEPTFDKESLVELFAILETKLSGTPEVNVEKVSIVSEAKYPPQLLVRYQRGEVRFGVTKANGAYTLVAEDHRQHGGINTFSTTGISLDVVLSETLALVFPPMLRS